MMAAGLYLAFESKLSFFFHVLFLVSVTVSWSDVAGKVSGIQAL